MALLTNVLRQNSRFKRTINIPTHWENILKNVTNMILKKKGEQSRISNQKSTNTCDYISVIVFCTLHYLIRGGSMICG